MAEMADAARLRGLPFHIVHGRLDWMFPVQGARQTQQALAAAGAAVTYRELDDLSHTYPRAMNGPMLDWLRGAQAPNHRRLMGRRFRIPPLGFGVDPAH